MAGTLIESILPAGDHASRPPTPGTSPAIRVCTTHNVIDRYTAAGGWVTWGTLGATALAGLTDVDLTGLANGNGIFYDSASGKFKPGAGGAGSSPRTKIADTTLASAASTITFSSIPGTYDDLEIVLYGKHTAATVSANIVLNSDTGANYKREIFYGTVSSPAAGSASSNAAMAIATTESVSVLRFAGYASTTRYKTASVRSDLPEDFGVYLYGLTWMNTAAITSISLQCPSGSFAAGTRARLYGLKDI